MMSDVSAASSSAVPGALRCVERCCPSTRHAKRSETSSLAATCSTHARRRAALRSFPRRLPSAPASPASAQPQPSATGHSPAPEPSGASPGPALARHTPCATYSRSAPSPRSPEPPPPPACPVPSAPQPAPACRRSPPVCDACAPFHAPPQCRRTLISGGPLLRGQVTVISEPFLTLPRPSRFGLHFACPPGQALNDAPLLLQDMSTTGHSMQEV